MLAGRPGAGGRCRARLNLRPLQGPRPFPIPRKMELMMPSFHNGAVEIAYLDEGEGDPIVLVHGFASSKNVNWVYPTWVSDLRKDGRRVIALDNRGHGDSEKLYDAAAYEIAIMASDVIALLDHLGIERADIMGYSLGSRMTAILAREQPQRLRSAILGGLGIGLIEGGGPGENVAIALEAPSLEDVTDPVGRTFRAFADQTRSDRRALAACLRGSRRLMTSDEAAGIRVPVLIAVGTRDEIAGSAAALGRIIPGAEVLDIPNRDHMRAVGDKVYKVGVIDFLSRRQ
jgi:pimeloyl-ACP methyl ester carboxylesterase